MERMVKRIVRMAAFAGVLALGGGCVAFNVGSPEVFIHRDTVTDDCEPPHKVELLSMVANARMDGKHLHAWLDADIQKTYWCREHDDTVTVKQQKRLAVGLFPAAAEGLLKPEEALDPILAGKIRDYYRNPPKKDIALYSLNTLPGSPKEYHFAAEYAFVQGIFCVGLLGIPQVIGTAKTLLIEPFTDWSLTHDLYDKAHTEPIVRPHQGGGGSYVLDTSVSPKLQLLQRFSREERQKMGFQTCFDPPDGKSRVGEVASSLGLAGFHKHLAVFVEQGTGPQRRVEKVSQERFRWRDPYEVTLRIPGAGIVQTGCLRERADQVTFLLPLVENAGQYDATLEFRSLYAGTNDFQKGWSTLTLRQLVWVPGKNGGPLAVQTQGREIHHYHETRVEVERRADPAREFDVEKAGDGTWRVQVLAESMNALDADKKAKPQILESLRKEFAERNPDVPETEIRAWATYTTADGGRTLVYEGAASSLIPSLESLSYDAATRRGAITMRLANRTGLAKSKQFVRENITAIVCDKNVALTAGERPPDGAQYRSLDENFADGVLRVEFEALE